MEFSGSNYVAYTFADYTISLTADEPLLRKRLIERRIACGHPREKSAEFVDFSDMALPDAFKES